MAETEESGRRNRFALMLVSLLLLLVVPPFVATGDQSTAQFLITVLFTVTLVASVYALSATKRSLIIAGMVAAPVLVLDWYDTVSPNYTVQVASHVSGMLFLFATVAVMMRYLLTCPRVTADTIYASLCVYLLLGVSWALAYSLIDALQPGAFAYSLAGDTDAWRLQFGGENSELALYYSFVTLTTLGYGDIVPVAIPARMLATLEAVTGQVYLTVLVARLVAMYISNAKTPEVDAG